jgi:ABC-type amino acid transport substrate-binding protein
LRTAKYGLLILCIASLSLSMIHCAKKGEKEITGAFDSMKKYKSVRILTSAVNPPFESGSGTSVEGFDVDIGQEITKDLGWTETKWVKQPSTELIRVLLNGEAEMVISAFPIETPLTPEQKAALAFSQPYYSSFDTISRRKDKVEIKDLASLAGKKVGVVSASTGEAFMKKAGTFNLTTFPTLDDGLGSLNRTEIDAMIGDGNTMAYSAYKSFQNEMTLDVHLNETQLAIALRKSEPELLQKVNATLDRLKSSGQLDQFRKKWFANTMEEMGKIRDGVNQNEALTNSPKSVIIEMVKTGGANFDMSRLDGYVAELVGPGNTYKSEPILTNGNKGTIKFPTAVPPGKYELRMTILHLTNEIPIPKKASKSMVFDMSIGSTIRIAEREK